MNKYIDYQVYEKHLLPTLSVRQHSGNIFDTSLIAIHDAAHRPPRISAALALSLSKSNTLYITFAF